MFCHDSAIVSSRAKATTRALYKGGQKTERFWHSVLMTDKSLGAPTVLQQKSPLMHSPWAEAAAGALYRCSETAERFWPSRGHLLLRPVPAMRTPQVHERLCQGRCY
mmetsp:Transcript_20925/g.31557  ORF Transcript_20925/g.31557 Transcript_20925/m.31557 type:complete len:107 (-) Transcript_20925:141-461(-)